MYYFMANVHDKDGITMEVYIKHRNDVEVTTALVILMSVGKLTI